MTEVDRLGIAEQTLVIFSSDNGPHEAGGADPEYFNSNGPFRGFKRDLYDGGIHVPFIASWPGTIPAGSTSDHQSAFWDFLPTMAELTGQPVPKHTDGISMLPTLLGQPGQQQHDHLYWEFHKDDGSVRVAVLKGNWKAVRYNAVAEPNSPLELYDLSKDPGETSNIALQHPETAAELDALIKQAHTEPSNPQFTFSGKKK
jgi:arylsulfatase A-like enzyme